MKKINWTRRNKLFAGLGGVAAALLAVFLVFTFVGMPGGGKLFGFTTPSPYRTFAITVNGHTYDIRPQADLRGANLTGANLTQADLYKADLSGAILRDADLPGANLYGANLTKADLTGAFLWRANLWRANLTNANLAGANLYEVTNLYEANLTGAKFFNTTMPDGTKR